MEQKRQPQPIRLGADTVPEASTEEVAAVVHIEVPTGKIVKLDVFATDCVLDLKHFLFECPETSDLTSFHLEFDGMVLNDYHELAEYPTLLNPANSTPVKIVPDYYDERGVRTHVRRLREVLARAAARKDATVSAKLQKKKATSAPAEEELPKFSLTHFFDGHEEVSTSPADRCVIDFTFSGWNPPPGNRRLRGDLLYLVAHTLEKNTLHITCATDGFFVNRSTDTVFDPLPAPSPYKSHTLFQLLRQASPLFMSKSSNLLNRKAVADATASFENLEVPYPQFVWTSKPQEHTFDLDRAEDALLDGHGMDIRGVIRDWNDEYQNCRELPRDTILERLTADRTTFRVFTDFVTAATKGAAAIVRGAIPPINPMEPKRAFVYIYNNIFFSHALDGRNLHANSGGDRVIHAISNNDMRGVQAFAQLEVPGVHTLITTIVTYLGERLICQGIIPGIFHGDRSSRHVYGSMDQGENIECVEDFHSVLAQTAQALHIKEHLLVDKTGKVVKLASAMDSKGIVGSDGRTYFLDIVRGCPRDANYPEPEKATFILREELVTAYCRQKAVDALLSSQLALAAKLENNADTSATSTTTATSTATSTTSSSSTTTTPITSTEEGQDETRADGKEPGSPVLVHVKEEKSEGKPDKKSGKKAARTSESEKADKPAAEDNTTDTTQENGKDEKESSESSNTELVAPAPETDAKSLLNEILFNPDCFTHAVLGGTPEQNAADEKQVRDLAVYLKDVVIPRMISGMATLEFSPVNGLTSLMHDKGINMRYLGVVATMCKEQKLVHFERMAHQEMICRVAKRLLGATLKDIRPDHPKEDHWFLAGAVARFLSSLFGKHCGGAGFTDDELDCAVKVMDRLEASNAEKQKREREWDSKVLAALENKGKNKPTEALLPAPKKKEEVPAKGKGKKHNKEAKQQEEVKLANGSRAPVDPLSPANLWTSIRAEINTSYAYDMPVRLVVDLTQRLSMLRMLCIKCGVKLACKDYSFDSDAVVTAEDVLDLEPVVKYYVPRSKDCVDALNDGIGHLAQGNLQSAYASLQEALARHSQVYGLMHVDCANCYANLALICYQLGDYPQAVEFQERALIIYEKVLRVDCEETAHAHSNLALFFHAVGEIEDALTHIRRALFLFELICGPNHPDTAATHTNIAMLYQDSGKVQLALKHLQEALRANKAALGENHAQVALSEHTIAVAFCFLGAFRDAVKHEQKSKQIFTAALGPKHPHVARSNFWIRNFTAGAVEFEQKGSSTLPAKMIQMSPLTWVSLKSSSTFKSRLTMKDLLTLVEEASSAENAESPAPDASVSTAAAPQASPAQPAQPAPATVAPGTEEASTTESSKAKKRRNKKKNKET